jgi:hypothetical protein
MNEFDGVYRRVTNPSELGKHPGLIKNPIREELYLVDENYNDNEIRTGEFMVCAEIDMRQLKASGYGFNPRILMESRLAPMVSELIVSKMMDGRAYELSMRDAQLDYRSPELLRCSKKIGIVLQDLADAREGEYVSSSVAGQYIRQFEKENPDKVLSRVTSHYQAGLMRKCLYWTKAEKIKIFELINGKVPGDFDIELDAAGVPTVSAQPSDIELG